MDEDHAQAAGFRIVELSSKNQIGFPKLSECLSCKEGPWLILLYVIMPT